MRAPMLGIPVVVWGCFFCASKVRKVGEWRQNGVIRGKMWFYYWENGIILEYIFEIVLSENKNIQEYS